MGNSSGKNSSVSPSLQGSTISSRRTFIIGVIDVQNDFCEGGALAVKDANSTIARINKLRFIYANIMKTFISQDYHPPNHMSFAKTHGKKEFSKEKLRIIMEDGITLEIEQSMWPVHCVKETFGAELHADLIATKKDILVRKGTDRNVESYSAFGDEYRGKYENTLLNRKLKELSITDIVLTGIATDYCVYYTALDALRYGYMVHLILSCTRGVAEDTTENALSDMKLKGVLFYDTIDDFYDYYDKLTSI